MSSSSSSAFGYLQGTGVLYELEDPETHIGRTDVNDIVLQNSRSISSVHARITFQLRGGHRTARLIDLNSMNATFVNDTRLHNESIEVHSGDIIRFGYDPETYRFFFPQDLPPSLLSGEDGTAAVAAALATASSRLFAKVSAT